MSSKRKKTGRKRSSQLVKGVPGGDCDSCSNWLFENIGNKPKGCRAKIGQIARDQFAMLFDDCAKQWAGKVLARAFVSLRKHHNQLSKVNRSYQDREKKLKKIRPDVLVPSSPVGQFLQRELRTSERYYNNLLLLREQLKRQPLPWVVGVNAEAVFQRIRDQLVLQYFAGSYHTKLKGKALARRYGALWTEQGLAAIEKRARESNPSLIYLEEIAEKRRGTWEDMAREWKIPPAYWPLKDFPPLSDESEKQWWHFIWSRLNEKKAEILPLLRASGEGRAEAKGGSLYLKHFYKQFHKHWLTLVKLREAGIF